MAEKCKGAKRWETDSRELYAETTKVAIEHGCDRGTFSVCFGEFEHGNVCVCREDAKKRLADRAATDA